VTYRAPTVLRVESAVLRGNALGDPTDRDIHVYLPPDHDPNRPTPALLALAGFTGNGAMLFNADPLGAGLGERLDRLIGQGLCPPVIVVAPDCFTRFGGNQFIDSTATGAYETYLVTEILPFVEKRFAVSRWGVFGKSSGGYGAMVLGMRHPERFEALADHSGDSNFELCYFLDAIECLDQVRAAGGVKAWVDAYWSGSQRRRGSQVKALNFLAMAAHYSPNPESPDMGIDFPFELSTGRFRADVWARWQAWDPVRMVASHQDALRRKRLVYVDCGTKDEFGLHWGARALVAELRAIGVEPVYEEFEDGHMNIPYRFERSIPLLVRALAETGHPE
jgi:S-formylglutathione hydrolase FrmB